MDESRSRAARVADGVDRVATAVGRIGGYGAILLTIFLVVYEVVARYVFNSPTQFTLEFGLILQIVVVAAAAAYVLKEGGHVGIELITERLSARARAWAGCVHAVFGFALCALYGRQLWGSGAWSLKINRLTEDVEMPLAPFQFLLLAGIVLLAVQFVVQGYRSYAAARADGAAPAARGEGAS